MRGMQQWNVLRCTIVALLLSLFGLGGLSPSMAEEEPSSVPVAANDEYEMYSFMGKQKVPAIDNDLSSDEGGALSYYDVSVTTSPYGDTTVKITKAGHMEVSIAPFDQGSTISWTYRVQDEAGTVSEPATVDLYIKPVKEMVARRTDRGRRASFKNRNEFDVLVRIDWSRTYWNKKEDKLFTVPARSSKLVRMHKRSTRYVAKALPWQKTFYGDSI